MSPTQYRALERLRDAVNDTMLGGLMLTLERHNDPGRIHPRTAEALERRGLAVIVHDEADPQELAVITDEGVALLEENPR